MPDLHHQITIAATPDKVYAAMATQAGMRAWWTADTTMQEKIGGNAEVGFGKRATVFRMTVETLEPGKRVVLSCHGDPAEWTGTKLTWTMTPQDASTVLRFTHAGWKAMTDMCALCNSSWGALTYRIKDYVEGKNPGPQWHE